MFPAVGAVIDLSAFDVIRLAAVALWCAWVFRHYAAVDIESYFIFRRGDWTAAARWRARLGPVMLAYHRDCFDLAIAEYSGQTAAALEIAERMLSRYPHVHTINQCVTTFVNAGRYRRALEIGAACSNVGKRRERDAWALLQVNLSEAEYNLGLWDEALARLESIRRRWNLPGIVRAGRSQQMAWILSHQGKVPEARAAIREVRVRQLPRIFHAEYQYTLAAASLAEGDAVAALGSVERGLKLARRAASARNGLFLRARILVAQGALEPALADFESAAMMSYQGQGGDGLLAWGDLLRSSGHQEPAHRAYRLATERDPESECSARARDRLSQSVAL